MSNYDFSKFTKEMQSMLPQWMKMSKDPKSVGAQFLNVFGMEFDDVDQYLDFISKNMFISSADIGQIDVVYRVPITVGSLIGEDMNMKISLTKEGALYDCELVTTVRNFYMAPSDLNIAIIDRENNFLYIRINQNWIEENVHKPVERVNINNTPHFDYQLHHIWNAFDEFGLLLGIRRMRGERNEDFKERLLDVFRKPGNSTKEGLLNALSRELGVSRDKVVMNELADPAFRKTLLNDDGSPTQKLIHVAKKTNEILGATWDGMSWDEAYWRSIEEDYLGLEYLPHVWDASMDAWADTDFQSGIGDGNDLKVRAPEKLENVRNFKYYVGLRGKQKGTELINPELEFRYKILAKGRIEDNNYRAENYRYTIVASEIVKLHYIIRASKVYYYDTKIDFTGPDIHLSYDSPSNPNCEIVSGQDIMSPESERYLRIEAYLQTYVKTLTPKLQTFVVKWEDTTGAIQELVFNTRADFDKNDSVATTTKMDSFSTNAGEIELGYGDFYHIIDTRQDFSKGVRRENITINSSGSIQLTPFTQ